MRVPDLLKLMRAINLSPSISPNASVIRASNPSDSCVNRLSTCLFKSLIDLVVPLAKSVSRDSKPSDTFLTTDTSFFMDSIALSILSSPRLSVSSNSFGIFSKIATGCSAVLAPSPKISTKATRTRYMPTFNGNVTAFVAEKYTVSLIYTFIPLQLAGIAFVRTPTLPNPALAINVVGALGTGTLYSTFAGAPYPLDGL